MHCHTKHFDKLDFYSLSPINSSASHTGDSDQDSVVSDCFHNRSGKIVQRPRECWEVDTSSDVQMKAFKNLSEVDSSFPQPKSDNEITLFPKLDEVGFVIDIVEEEELKGHWEVVNEPN
jgi:hypothetical protein